MRKLYARHFGISETELLNTIKNNVELISLKQPIKVNSYYVGESGKYIYVKKKLLPKGSLVFATKDGKPLLLWSCGNPLVTILPQPPKKKVVVKPVATPSEPTTKVEAFTETIEAPPTPAPIETVAAPTEVLPVLETPPQIAQAIAQTPAFNPGAPLISPNILGVIGGLAPILGILASSQDDEPIKSVPEPSAVIAMGGLLITTLPFIKRRVK